MGFGIEIDVSAAEAALDRIVTLCQAAAFTAARKSADEIQTRTRALLFSRWHKPSTKTPSSPGSPPASISGDLGGSVLVTDDGESAFVGPTTDYGRIQELGGTMHGHPMMHWQQPPGFWHHSAEHDLPKRPYLKPAVEASLGEIEDIFYNAWEAAIAEALA